MSRFMDGEGGERLISEWSFAELSDGSGAVAMLISEVPDVFQIDVGASGAYGYEVMDNCRPKPDTDAGDSYFSLKSILGHGLNAAGRVEFATKTNQISIDI